MHAIKITMGSLFSVTCKSWLTQSFAFLALSGAAVLVRLTPYYIGYNVPHVIHTASELFTTPGSFVLLLTTGAGIWSGPTLPEYMVILVLNTALWTAAGICVALVRSWVVSYLKHEKNDS